METSGELKIIKGVRSFDAAESIEVAGLVPRIDSPSFTFMAWIKLRKGGGATIVRKPLGCRYYYFSRIAYHLSLITSHLLPTTYRWSLGCARAGALPFCASLSDVAAITSHVLSHVLHVLLITYYVFDCAWAFFAWDSNL